MVDTCENGWQGSSDVDQLKRAYAEGRVVVTHDRDFGSLAIQKGEPTVGIVYLRPGHNDATFTIGNLQILLRDDPDLTPPFLVVAKRSGAFVNIRVRHIGP